VELFNGMGDAAGVLTMADAAKGGDDVDPCNDVSSEQRFRAKLCSSGCS